MFSIFIVDVEITRVCFNDQMFSGDHFRSNEALIEAIRLRDDRLTSAEHLANKFLEVYALKDRQCQAQSTHTDFFYGDFLFRRRMVIIESQRN